MKSLFPRQTAMVILVLLSSCVTQKKYLALQDELNHDKQQLQNCNQQRDTYQSNLNICNTSLNDKNDQYKQLAAQLADCQAQRDKQLTQVGDLTVLSKKASDNINQTLGQLENKDKYIQLLLAAKNKADSINLALAVNLKGVLKDGIEDQDVEIKVDKTVVFINLSDKMLYRTGSYEITDKAKGVLSKIASIIETRPDVLVMVEGYTDNKKIKTACMEDNWDLSVKRATSVVRVLQNEYNVNPNMLEAAGRGEYNTLASNDTEEGRAQNRRTRIIILPKLDQFYDLLDPTKANNGGVK